ncbi:TraR/DksA C4-type zinc finger protein [Streptomyces aureus]|uniref:TraR/DksA C4-type zinc finger protein n=1 Tax=Streptomyces aureus TaxID=193461 RepID=UPI00055E1C3E|nr:TraR/DksA C4-type zinc finger protein [Streptomyces aureus]
MVAKKTAVQQSASGRSTDAAARDAGGRKGARAASETAGAKPVKRASRKAAPSARTASAKPGGTAASSGEAPTKATDGKAGTGKAAGKPGSAKSASSASAAKRNSGGSARKSTGTARRTAAPAAQGAAEAAKTTGATTVVAKKTRGAAAAAKKTTAVPKARIAALEPGELAVRPGEDPWTPDEVGAARAELQSEVLRLGAEISSSEEGLAGLMRDSGDGAGDDEADTGTKNITREHEMALNANAREMLEQTERALDRLDAGTYGLCENCGNAIGKARMQAFPRATLCVECKQKQERRH